MSIEIKGATLALSRSSGGSAEEFANALTFGLALPTIRNCPECATFQTTSKTYAFDLQRAMISIVTSRWPDADRPARSQGISIRADRNTSMQTIAEVIAAVRVSPDGLVLFPNVELTFAFE